MERLKYTCFGKVIGWDVCRYLLLKFLCAGKNKLHDEPHARRWLDDPPAAGAANWVDLTRCAAVTNTELMHPKNVKQKKTRRKEKQKKNRRKKEDDEKVMRRRKWRMNWCELFSCLQRDLWRRWAVKFVYLKTLCIDCFLCFSINKYVSRPLNTLKLQLSTWTCEMWKTRKDWMKQDGVYIYNVQWGIGEVGERHQCNNFTITRRHVDDCSHYGERRTKDSLFSYIGSPPSFTLLTVYCCEQPSLACAHQVYLPTLMFPPCE